MRKNIAIFALALIISIPFVSIAETAPATLTADQKSVWDVLIVLITQLTNQVESLTAENTALRATCSQASTVPVTPTFGSVTNNATIQTMPDNAPASIEVQVVSYDKSDSVPLGQYYFNVGVKFTDGSTKDSSQVSVVWPSDQDKSSQDAENVTKQTTQQGFLGRGVHSIQFGPYVPTSLGTKTITFTSGGLSKSVTVEVK